MEDNQKGLQQHQQQIITQPNSHQQENHSIIIQHHRLLQFQLLQGTIHADTSTNQHFIINHAKLTLALLLFILLLQLLPSPLIINVVEHDPQQFTKENCSEEQCSNEAEGYETVIVKKINPLHRQLKLFVRLSVNGENVKRFSKMAGVVRADLSQQITFAQIYAIRDNEIYGEPIQEIEGSQAFEILFNGQPLIYIGKVYILNEASYMLKIYKIIHRYKAENHRNLDENPPHNQEEPEINQGNLVKETDYNYTTQQSSNTRSGSPQQTNSTELPIDRNKNTTEGNQSYRNQTGSQERQISVPLSIHLVRYSQFFTSFELVVRYVTFLYILYVRTETKDSPFIFHFILLATANPLIFTEIAFPNNTSHIISLICNSMYIFYLALFLDFTHRPLHNQRLDIFVRTLKLILTIALYLVDIVRQTYQGYQSTSIEIAQYLLFCIVAIPIFQYLWRIYFFKSRTILHRNLLFISLTVYYGLLLFFTGYLVSYGWKKISMYLIIQFYGIKLCYLTAPIPHSIPLPHLTSSANFSESGQNNGEKQLSEKNPMIGDKKYEEDGGKALQNQDNIGLFFISIKGHYA